MGDRRTTSGLTRITAQNGPWPLHGSAASRRIEAAAHAQAEPGSLMEAAGAAVARLALALAPHARRVYVWAGPGNNGGDGLVAARHLHLAGKAVRVGLLANAAAPQADTSLALERARQAGVAIDAGCPTAAGGDSAFDLSIDALLGLGSNRAPEGAIADAIVALQSARHPVLAVDLPSGLHPDTGALFGPMAVRATATLSLLTLKPGCFTAAGRDHAGQVWLDTLGQAHAGDQAAGLAAAAWLGGPPPSKARQHASHKGRFGDVAVVGGSAGMTGAAWLAARAALAAGAGRVCCSLLDPAAALLDPLRPELMGRRDWWLSPPAVLAKATVACGCGGGNGVRAALPPLLAFVPRLVLDADALNAIAADGALQAALRARAPRGLATLLTPHPLEAARLLRQPVEAVQADRVAAARGLAQRDGVAVLLKGSGSVIATPGQAPCINATGNGALATAGTGDVLAGWAAGLWAQDPEATAADIGATAAWQHGRAADDWVSARPDAARGAPLRASDLVEALASRR